MRDKTLKKPLIYMSINFLCLLILISIQYLIFYYTPFLRKFAGSPKLYGTLKFIIVLPILLGPISEEIIFRKWILNFFRKRTKYYNLIQALLFGVWHFHLYQGIYTAIYGIFLGNVIRKYEKIWITIYLHILFNFSGFFLKEHYIIFMGEITGWDEVLMATLPFILPIIIFLWSLKKLGNDMYRLW